MSCQGAHVGYHLGCPQAIHSNFALRSSELECSSSGRRGRVDDLDEVIFKLAAVLERAAHKVGIRCGGASMEPRAGEVENRRNTIGLDGFTAEVLGTF